MSGSLEDVVSRIVDHAEGRQHLSEFTDSNLGQNLNVNSTHELKSHVITTLSDPDTQGFTRDFFGKHLAFYNANTNTFIAVSPGLPHGGTVFRPDEFGLYFDKQIETTSERLGTTPEVVRGGYDAVVERWNARAREMAAGDGVRGHADDLEGSNFTFVDAAPETGSPRVVVLGDGTASVKMFGSADEALQAYGERYDQAHALFHGEGATFPEVRSGGLGALASEVEDLRTTTVWEKVGRGAGAAGEFLGRASKVLGPVGVAATTAEAASLRDRVGDLATMGIIDGDSRPAYDALLAGHVAQGTADPTLVGGEAATQLAYKAWADGYGIPEHYREELRPGSLARDVGAGAEWVGERIGNAVGGVRARLRGTGADESGITEVSAAPVMAPAEMPTETLSWKAVHAQLAHDLPASRSQLDAHVAAHPEATETTKTLWGEISQGVRNLDRLVAAGVPHLEVPGGTLDQPPAIRLGMMLDAGRAQAAELERSAAPRSAAPEAAPARRAAPKADLEPDRF